MANTDSTVGNPKLINLSNQLHIIAAQLAGIAPILNMMMDAGDLGEDGYKAGNSLSLIGGAADSMNHEICLIADKVNEIGRAETA